MSNEAFEINIPDNKSGRIYVGVSWDDIFDKTTAKNLTKGDIRSALFTGLLSYDFLIKRKFLWYYLAFVILGQTAYLQFYSFNWTATLVAFAISNLLFSLWMYRSLKAGGIRLLTDNQQKDEDLSGRDKKYGQFDIDLHCFVFDQNKNFLFEIDPIDKQLSPNDPPSIYHSGEETDGAGVFDDETIHVETKKLKDEYGYFVFAVANDCAHDFDKINNLKVRLVNSLKDTTIHESTIDSSENDGYAYCCVYKKDDKWFYKPFEKYIKFDQEWKSKVTELLQTM